MTDCKHQSLEFVGEQRTDDGVNAYYTCKACGILLVVTPSTKVIGVKGLQSGTSSTKRTEGNS